MLNMLRVAEKDLKKSKAASTILLVNKTKKRKGKGKAKEVSIGPQKKQRKGQQKPVSKEKDVICYFCSKKGHWKRNCSSFLERKKDEAFPSGIYTIECNLSSHVS